MKSEGEEGVGEGKDGKKGEGKVMVEGEREEEGGSKGVIKDLYQLPMSLRCSPEIRVHIVLYLVQSPLLLTGHPLSSHYIMLRGHVIPKSCDHAVMPHNTLTV